VIIAEINQKTGREAARRLEQELGSGRAYFIHTDVGEPRSVHRLTDQALRRFKRVDIVLNNATVAPLGSVKDSSIRDWDNSYQVNLRGPVLLAHAFLPGMLARRHGVFVCVSSQGAAYMGAYETLKAAQVHLGTTLDAELAGSGVIAFSIGPGFAPTQTALSAMPRLAALMGVSLAELQTSLQGATISIEAAGAGFAAAIAMAERYHGQEIASLQALHDAGIELPSEAQARPGISLEPAERQQALQLCQQVRQTLAEQGQGWKERSVFEQQWLVRTFRNRAGLPLESWLDTLARLERSLATDDGAALAQVHAPLGSLANYYSYLAETAKGYIKDPSERDRQVAIVQGWRADVEALQAFIQK
jgi:NAD(P)-dependent dehydrogenase (short-subunit alcohol dehydrogenase family)